ncbi:sulfur carrier protein ThiS [Novosphingobium sp. BW1]|uniref:sulfur carrier protein ThiS n=1 Tax=Novosphingobium sp. BW1 TaxID=2592621 RepID=UPI00352D7055
MFRVVSGAQGGEKRRARFCLAAGNLALGAGRAICTHMAQNDTPNALISLTVNGEPHRIAAGSTIADLVAEIGLDPAKVAVERNAEIAPRSTLADVTLGEGDTLEIVHFVGGG